MRQVFQRTELLPWGKLAVQYQSAEAINSPEWYDSYDKYLVKWSTPVANLKKIKYENIVLTIKNYLREYSKSIPYLF